MRPPRRGRLILAEGEATGHAHAIAERDAREFRVGDERFLLVRSAAQLIHEEHAAIDLPPGSYRVVIQREYAPAPIPDERLATGGRLMIGSCDWCGEYCQTLITSICGGC